MNNSKALPGKAPLVEALLRHREANPAPFYMPGHKGRPLGLETLAPTSAWDMTELPGTGNLYEGGDVIAQAEELWAHAFGFPTCQFLTGGSTQGLHAALLLAAREGRELLADRCSHRSVFNAMALLDLNPTYLVRGQDAPVTPEGLEEALLRREKEGRPANTVCVTSPTYYGVLSDVKALSRVAHAHGAQLVVDGAHGCHLPFLGKNPFEGADLLVCSAHKTLPVYGQGALLFAAGGYSPKAVRHAASMVGTSSPSYPVMASMDYARAWLESKEGQLALLCVKSCAATLTARFGGLGASRSTSLDGREEARFGGLGASPFTPPDGREEVRIGGAAMDASVESVRPEGLRVDPLRLTLEVPDRGGFELKKCLEEDGVFPEMADRDHVVFLFSTGNTQGDFDRLRKALERWYTPGSLERAPLPPEPEQILSPAASLLARRASKRLDECEGLVAAEQLAPYPPGIPVVAPGERITKKCLAYLADVGYNVHQEVDVLPQKAAAPRERETL